MLTLELSRYLLDIHHYAYQTLSQEIGKASRLEINKKSTFNINMRDCQSPASTHDRPHHCGRSLRSEIYRALLSLR